MSFSFKEKWQGVEFYVGELRQCMKAPMKTKEECVEQILGEKRWTSPSNKRYKANARTIIEENYMHLLTETEMPEKMPTFSEPAVGGETEPRPLKWNFSIQKAEHFQYNSGVYTHGEVG